jgi:SAM-dependent methyltransferase
VHNSHKAGQAEFLRGGGSTLFPEEIALAGDVRGQRLLHLCCNAGPDTLSWAARGAIVTGIDISDEAITYARALSVESGLPGEFVRGDVYDVLAELAEAGRRFDVVFYSYGSLVWLSDLPGLMRLVERVLAPGGRLVGVEFHPLAWVFDEDGRAWTRPYFWHGAPDTASGVSDYVGRSDGALVPWDAPRGEPPGWVNPHEDHAFYWNMGEILAAVIAAPLRLTTFAEWPYTNGCKLWERMVPAPGRRFTLPAGEPDRPLMYGLCARRDA